MNIVQLINEVLTEMVNERGSTWYHGTPDAREINQNNGFSPRTATASIVTDPQKYNELQQEMQKARAEGNEELYFQLLKAAGELHGTIQFKKPIFFTTRQDVARTYADPWRAFDYQEAKPRMFQVEIDDSGKILTLDVHGEKFRGIGIDVVKKALMNDGVDEATINHYLQIFQNSITHNGTKMSTDDLAVIAQQLGYDIVDVVGVLDSYRGGTIKSTVRMVFDPSRIKII